MLLRVVSPKNSPRLPPDAGCSFSGRGAPGLPAGFLVRARSVAEGARSRELRSVGWVTCDTEGAAHSPTSTPIGPQLAGGVRYRWISLPESRSASIRTGGHRSTRLPARARQAQHQRYRAITIATLGRGPSMPATRHRLLGAHRQQASTVRAGGAVQGLRVSGGPDSSRARSPP